MSDTQTIEINGVKFEVDARTATLRKIETIAIGARIKILEKNYGDTYEVHHGVVIGFEPFQNLPTVVVAYVKASYSTAPEIKFLYYNAKSTVEIVISDENDREALAASNVIANLDREILKKQNEIIDLQDRKQYFLSNFATYWSGVDMPSLQETAPSVN